MKKRRVTAPCLPPTRSWQRQALWGKRLGPEEQDGSPAKRGPSHGFPGGTDLTVQTPPCPSHFFTWEAHVRASRPPGGPLPWLDTHSLAGSPHKETRDSKPQVRGSITGAVKILSSRGGPPLQGSARPRERSSLKSKPPLVLAPGKVRGTAHKLLAQEATGTPAWVSGIRSVRQASTTLSF